MFTLSKAVTFALLPPGLFVLLLAAGLVCLAVRRGRAAAALFSVSLALCVALSSRPVADALILPLEDRYPVFSTDATAGAARGVYGAVVVLGGGSVDRSPEEGGHASLWTESEKRLVYGERLARKLGLPLIYSGGRVFRGAEVEAEADAARRFLSEEGYGGSTGFDDESRTTRENALFVKRKFGLESVILVTSAYHMPRAVLSFVRAGMKVLPAPTDYKVDRSGYVAADYFPSMKAFQISWQALHEYLGLAGYGVFQPRSAGRLSRGRRASPRAWRGGRLRTRRPCRRRSSRSRAAGI